MRITHCRTNHLENPLGFCLEPLRLSWIAEESASAAQAWARVEIAADMDFKKPLYDSGEQRDASSLAFFVKPNDLALMPRTRYWWRVTVRGDAGDAAISDVNWFETGKMTEGWQAGWISPSFDDDETHPLFRHEFWIGKEIKEARAYATGLGLYRLKINGQKTGDELFTPGCNAYDRWIQVQAYDVTALLRQGGNAAGAMLGRGWARGRMGGGGDATGNNYLDRFAFLCEIHIVYTDGTEEIIGTGPDWQVMFSPVVSSDIYDGETYDANLECPAWSAYEADASGWSNAVPCDPGLGALRDRLSPPVRIVEERKPVAILRTPAGETVLDAGQNMTGWVRFKADAPKGHTFSLAYGETLQGGNFYRENLRTAKAEYHYISGGGKAKAEPLFTYFGFRYVKLEGFGENPSIDDFTVCVVHTELERTGWIETSDGDVNRLFENILWSQKGNFLDVPTDCPQRDERLGWTGDAQVFSATALFNMDAAAFYAKYLADVEAEQGLRQGGVPGTVPNIYPKRVSSSERRLKAAGEAGWGDAATVIPWNVYLFTGDKGILQRQFGSMKAWVDCIRAIDDVTGGRRLWTTGFQYGDWLALDASDPQSISGATDAGFLASAYYCRSARIVAKAAAVLGKAALADEYAALSEEVRTAILKEYFSENGRCAVDTQTALLAAIGFELIPEAWRERAASDLKARMIRDGVKLKTGFLGTPLICRVLSDAGLADYAYRVFLRRSYPGWLYAVGLGATTVWECWDAMLPDGTMNPVQQASLNHYAYGCVAEWMYRDVCGINPVEEHPGFRHILLRPRPGGSLMRAAARVSTASGIVECGWEIGGDGRLAVTASVPFGSTATMMLPEARAEDTDLNGKPLAQSMLTFRQEGSAVRVELTAGRAVFAYPIARGIQVRFSVDTPLGELLGNEEAGKALVSFLPVLGRSPDYMKGATLRELAQMLVPDGQKEAGILYLLDQRLSLINPYR